MGFLKFLKKKENYKESKAEKKAEDINNLDMPPPLPDFGEKRMENLQSMMKLDNPLAGHAQNNFNQIKKPGSQARPPLKQAAAQSSMDLDMERFMSSKDEAIPMPKRPMPSLNKFEGIKHKLENIEEEEDKEEEESEPVEEEVPKKEEYKPVIHERRVHKRIIGGDIFINVESMGDIFDEIKASSYKLKVINDSLKKINSEDSVCEKRYRKWHSILSELQQKVLSIEKTIIQR